MNHERDADLSSELDKVRELRREGRHDEAEAIVNAGTSVQSLVDAAEAARGRRLPGGQDWYDGLAPQVRAAAELLHQQRHSTLCEIAEMQVEIDRIDAALDGLTKVES